jgi:hypothetical protein
MKKYSRFASDKTRLNTPSFIPREETNLERRQKESRPREHLLFCAGKFFGGINRISFMPEPIFPLDEI